MGVSRMMGVRQVSLARDLVPTLEPPQTDAPLILGEPLDASIGDVRHRRLRLPFLSEAPSSSPIRLRERRYRRALGVADAIAAYLALYVAVVVLGDGDRLKLASVVIIPIVVAASKLMGLYDRDHVLLNKATLDEAPALFHLATLYALLTWVLKSVMVDATLGNNQVFGLWALLLAFALVGRAFAREFARRTTPAERCLLVGPARGLSAVARRIQQGGGMKVTVVGHLPLGSREHPDTLQDLERTILRHDVHRVVLAPGESDSEDMLDIVSLVKNLGVRVSFLPRMLEVVGSSVEFDTLNGITVLGVRNFGLGRSSLAVKRTTDLVGAGLGLLAMAPFMALVAAAIRLESRGPAFFRQERVGRDGERFMMLKFRTMVDGADAMKRHLQDHNEAEGLFKIAADPRITRVGGCLRRTSLDELPQLLNVVRREMSLVGPRPLILDEDRMIEGRHRRRLHLTPGMTGPWQILGSARIPLEEMVKIDYLYVANWSFWGDVKILARTILYMFRARGM